MITLHWSWIAFTIIVAVLVIGIVKSANEPRGDYGFDITSPFLLIILIAFILIWGGIFWW